MPTPIHTLTRSSHRPVRTMCATRMTTTKEASIPARSPTRWFAGTVGGDSRHGSRGPRRPRSPGCRPGPAGSRNPRRLRRRAADPPGSRRFPQPAQLRPCSVYRCGSSTLGGWWPRRDGGRPGRHRCARTTASRPGPRSSRRPSWSAGAEGEADGAPRGWPDVHGTGCTPEQDPRQRGQGRPSALSGRTPTSRCRSATAGRRGRARGSPPAVGRAATGTRVALRSGPLLPVRQHVRP